MSPRRGGREECEAENKKKLMPGHGSVSEGKEEKIGNVFGD
jgi:hypothetical protein